MAAERIEYICGECGVSRISDDTPPGACPQCGHTGRLVKKPIDVKAGAQVSMSAKAKRPGDRKPFLEHLSRADFFRKAGKWVQKVRRINRRDDRYFEEVIDPETGDVIHRCDEPLSEHRDHGSAKPNNEA
jgi:DNA-directed RNA polymerase subunit RPC12/RpoP